MGQCMRWYDGACRTLLVPSDDTRANLRADKVAWGPQDGVAARR
jgi:hypothetical protein